MPKERKQICFKRRAVGQLGLRNPGESGMTKSPRPPLRLLAYRSRGVLRSCKPDHRRAHGRDYLLKSAHNLRSTRNLKSPE